MLSLPNKFFIILLSAYTAIQALSLVVHATPIYMAYEIIFLALIIAGIVILLKASDLRSTFTEFKRQCAYMIYSGMLLTVLYFIALLTEPAFNWDFKPDFSNFQTLLIYFPMVQALIAVLLLIIPIGLKYLLGAKN